MRAVCRRAASSSHMHGCVTHLRCEMPLAQVVRLMEHVLQQIPVKADPAFSQLGVHALVGERAVAPAAHLQIKCVPPFVGMCGRGQVARCSLLE